MFPVKQNNNFLVPAQHILKQFSEFVLKWQKSINLIAPSTIPDIWQRHILDSAQLYPYIPDGSKTLVDMGSGAGFPGVVLALLNKTNKGSLERFYLIESDMKKCIFLQEAVRLFDIPVIVLNERLENVNLPNIDVVTARALKEVKDLLVLGKGFITPCTTCLFLKGEKVDEELKSVVQDMRVEKFPSQTHEKGCILKMEVIQK